jgi:deoxyadenosine/deoxycytidine kinase
VDQHLPSPGLLIYLHVSIPKLQTNIARRGRSFEQAIPDEYLVRVQHAYQQYLKQGPSQIIVIDMEAVDFLEDAKQFSELIRFIEQKPAEGTRFFPAKGDV